MIRATLAILVALGAAGAGAAELPSRNAKNEPAGAKAPVCEIGGEPGVLAANGTCVRVYGSIDVGVGVRNVKH